MVKITEKTYEAQRKEEIERLESMADLARKAGAVVKTGLKMPPLNKDGSLKDSK